MILLASSHCDQYTSPCITGLLTFSVVGMMLVNGTRTAAVTGFELFCALSTVPLGARVAGSIAAELSKIDIM